MPRMTTCRSDRSLLLVLALAAGFAPAARAQDAARPSTHTVRPGDTLWDLARQYLGDPFLWPQIYRLNTDVIADPHWIYPGEVLRLAAGAETRAVPSPGAEPAAPAQTPGVAAPQPAAGGEWTEPGMLFPRRSRAELGSAILAVDEAAYRALSRGDFYASGFMTEGQALPLGEFLGNIEPMQIAVLAQRSFTLLNDIVGVRAPEGATYRAGDTLLVVTLAEGVSGQPRWGDIVRPTGMVVVTGAGEGRMVAHVIAIYGELRDGQYVLPAERFVSNGSARPVPVTDGVTGRILLTRERNPIRHPQDIVFLDIGRSAGVALGDLFEVVRELEGGIPERIATLQVVHTRDASATARIVSLTAGDFPPRPTVRQIARLPR